MEIRAITPQEVTSKTIRELLDSDHVCREIVHYLMRNSEAADTASGIAEWWIKQDIGRTAQALTKLRELGVVRSHLVQDATSVYTFTKSPRLRKTLSSAIAGSSGDAEDVGRSTQKSVVAE